MDDKHLIMYQKHIWHSKLAQIKGYSSQLVSFGYTFGTLLESPIRLVNAVHALVCFLDASVMQDVAMSKDW